MLAEPFPGPPSAAMEAGYCPGCGGTGRVNRVVPTEDVYPCSTCGGDGAWPPLAWRSPPNRRLLARPRWANHLYAALRGLFWLECPACHRMFGGHEYYRQTTGIIVVPLDPNPRKVTCWRCPS